MSCKRTYLVAATILVGLMRSVAQELEPRAYSVSPTGANFLVAGFARSAGDIDFDPALPIENASARLYSNFFAYGRSVDFLGRSASVAVTLPYLWGNLQGTISGAAVQARRSGLMNPAMRFSVNLYGAQAMDLEEFARYRRKTIVGASLAIVAPLGQYDPARLINIGTNRWAAKPELGISRRFGNWFFDLYLGAWFFSANQKFKGRVRTQDPIISTQTHVSYAFRPRLWAAFDTNFYTGGTTSIDGLRNRDLQRNSRVGGTISIPMTKRQSLKFSGSTGAVTNIGADFISIGVAYQYLWGGGL
jgi:hypothetical protein